MRQIIFLAFLLASSVFLFAQAQPPASSSSTPSAALQTFKLPATPKTVAWGYYDAAAPPVLHIHSGDTVVFDTQLTNIPTALEPVQVAPDHVPHEPRAVSEAVTSPVTDPHILH